MIIKKLRTKLKDKQTLHSRDQNEVDRFCSDFKKATSICPNLLKCNGYENFKHFVKFALLKSTLIYEYNYLYYSSLSQFLPFYFDLFICSIPDAQEMRYSRRWISWCRYLYSLVSQQVAFQFCIFVSTICNFLFELFLSVSHRPMLRYEELESLRADHSIPQPTMV